ncbi:MAG: ABC transporter ATP-binding protein [Bacteroidetes bacterium]|nr:MAG: ABC transporter ATP-binding protein [Bacteroidota bacterium]
MSKTVLSVEQLSKQYRLGEVGTGTISHDLNRWWSKVRGKEDPYLKVGETNDRTNKGTSQYTWALQDICFDVKQGEVLGIIGKNGAGKSTLLKILSKVTGPTKGTIKSRGRIAALLEVGTGFHPELTGKENIFLNGTILGMTKKEVKSKLDEIVDFAGVERYLDTPVKRYSSGMMVRLGFSVAAHLEPEILIVDEVLAVGDAEFQKKCIGKMGAVAKGGRTILFVSHNMGSVKSLCTQAILLENGQKVFEGSVSDTIAKYVINKVNTSEKGIIDSKMRKMQSDETLIQRIAMLAEDGTIIEELYYKQPIDIKVNFEANQTIKDALIDIMIISQEGIIISHYMNTMNGYDPFVVQKGDREIMVRLNNDLAPGNYSITVGIHYSNGLTIEVVEDVYSFTVLKASLNENGHYPYEWSHGYLHPKAEWKLI